MMRPEEKLAERLIKRHELKPPFDLLALASLYADVEETYFPIAGDGITIGLGGSATPSILINSEQVKTRKKFTLAHELGHVIIPWHTGTILSDESDTIQGEFEYREMEGEANRFAAELLMPTDWIVSECENARTVESFIKKIIDDSGVSRDAGLIKVFNVIKKPIICIETDCSESIIKIYKPKKCMSPSFDFLDVQLNQNLINENINIPFQYESFTLLDRFMHTYSFDKVEFICTDTREWREILNDIIDSVDTDNPQKLKLSINATLASKYQSYKSSFGVQELCANIFMGFSGVEKFEGVYNNPVLKVYIYKRVIELLEKDKQKSKKQ